MRFRARYDWPVDRRPTQARLARLGYVESGVIKLLNGSEEAVPVFGFDPELEFKGSLHNHTSAGIGASAFPKSTGKVFRGEEGRFFPTLSDGASTPN